jgi:hypothetical protein
MIPSHEREGGKLMATVNCDYKFYPDSSFDGWKSGASICCYIIRQTASRKAGCITAPTQGLNTAQDNKLEPMYCNSRVKRVKLSTCVINHHALRMHGRADIQLHKFSSSAADESVSLKPRPLYPRGKGHPVPAGFYTGCAPEMICTL